MIRPTVGRVVLLNNRPGNQGPAEAALIAFVHSDTCINVGGFDHNGHPMSATSVPLIQEGEPMPVPPHYEGIYAEWMPYQKGQAARTEQLQAELAARPPSP